VPPSNAHPLVLTPFKIFQLTDLPQQAIMVLLVIASLAALAVAAAKLSGGQRLAGGSAYLSGLRLGGPIIGGLGAAWSLLNATIGYANVGGDLPIRVMTPGFAEALLQISLGFFAGAVAVFANWAVESRIDRQVLGA